MFVMVITGRMPQSGTLPVFTSRPKISIFALQGRLFAPIHVKFGTTKGHVCPLGHIKFHANRFTGVGMWPPKWQKFPFLVKSRLAGANTLTDF